jgi:hypothetical protein
MAYDIDNIISFVSSNYPWVTIKKLQVRHAADDDGLWFFANQSGTEVQLESSTYNFPFLIESNRNDKRTIVDSLEQAISVICFELGIK